MSAIDNSHKQHALRVLVVDDNALNLAVLTRLLNKKFRDVIDDSSLVAVDSGLKALQLLRDNVFDVIFMDIQMPFLSGVDCTERIRQGRDGVLQINRTARIVAVTTAVGDEPELLYRRKGFDGLIAKPVVYDSMRELLHPLSSAATVALDKITALEVDHEGRKFLPPLPPPPYDDGSSVERLFFLPSGDRRASAGDVQRLSEGSSFEALLQSQTRESLHRYGAGAMAKTRPVPNGVSDRLRLRHYDEDASASASDSEGSGPSRALDLHSTALAQQSAPASPMSPKTRSPHRSGHLSRHGSLTISQSALHAQLEREMKAASLELPDRRSQRPATHRSSAPILEAPEFKVHPAHIATSGVERQDEPLSPAEEWQRYTDSFTGRLGAQLAPFDRRRSSGTESGPSTSSDDSSAAYSSGDASPNDVVEESSSAVTTPGSDADGGGGVDDPFAWHGDKTLSRYSFEASKRSPVDVASPTPCRPSLQRHEASARLSNPPQGEGLCSRALAKLDLSS